jgi:molybdopterin adenylyltransferase
MSAQRTWPAAVVTVSDGVAEGVREDTSGRAVADLLTAGGLRVDRREVVSDDSVAIATLLQSLADQGISLVVTTGGTGLGPRDVTPEATREVIEREAPGLAEEMRAAGRSSTPLAALSRGIAGSRASTLIVNLPGSPRGAVESLSAIMPALPHALALLAGDSAHRPADARLEPGSGPEGHAVEAELARRRTMGEDVVLATAVRVEGDPPCRVGQKILVGRTGPLAGTLGCSEFDDAAVADAPAILARRAPGSRVYQHELGSVEVFLEPLLRRPQLIVFSATPVALHLMRWAADLSFDPLMVESRAGRVSPEHRAAGRTAQGLEGLTIGDDSAAVLTDHDAPGVAESLAALLRTSVRFIGVMGSARHVGPHMERLREMGFEERDLARIRTPVGIDIGAHTAEEIALSILAGLVADRAGAGGGWLDRRPASGGGGSAAAPGAGPSSSA